VSPIDSIEETEMRFNELCKTNGKETTKMKKLYGAIVEVYVEFEADEDNLPESTLEESGSGELETLEGLAMNVIYGRDEKDHDRTDQKGIILDFLSVEIDSEEEVDELPPDSLITQIQQQMTRIEESLIGIQKNNKSQCA
jgi:hypothetical protein